MNFCVFIPARLGSTRLPAKPLIKIEGRSIIQRVYQNCIESGAEKVFVATDAESIKAEVESFGGRVCMTPSNLNSGSDRIAKAIASLSFKKEDVIVNVQGDEPFLSPEVIKQVGKQVNAEKQYVATIYEECDPTKKNDVNSVKVVTDQNNFAMYFSRSRIPFNSEKSLKKHVGIYGYTVGKLLNFITLAPPDIEQSEKLEQLRFLYYGMRIKALKAVGEVGIGIDTKEDLDKAKIYLAR